MRMIAVALGTGVTGFTASGADDWVTVPTTLTEGNLEISLTANTGRRNRRDTVIFTPVGGMGEGSTTTDTLLIMQLGTDPAGQSLTLDPSIFGDVSHEMSTLNVGLRLGGGATGYTTSATRAWVTLVAPMTMGEPPTITIAANTTSRARKDTIVFTPTGGTNTVVVDDTLFITQNAIPQTVRVAGIEEEEGRNIIFVPFEGAMGPFRVIYGGGATGHRVSTLPDWIMLSAGADGQGTVTISANSTTMERRATITFTPTGGEGKAISYVLLVIQSGPVPTATVSPDNLDILVAGGATMSVTVTLTHGATSFNATTLASWVQITPMSGEGGEVMIRVAGNPSHRIRRAEVIFEPSSETLSDRDEVKSDTLRISQLGIAVMGPSASLDPHELLDLPFTAGTYTTRVRLTGGATGYTTTASRDWLTVPARGMAAGEVSIMLEANTGLARKDTVYFVPTGGMGTVTRDTLYVSQLGNDLGTKGISVTSVPASLSMLSAAAGSARASIALSGPVSGWAAMVNTSGFTTTTTTSGMGNGMITLNYTANATNAVRRDTVAFFTTGGVGPPARDTLFFIQQGMGAPPSQSFGVSGAVFADVRVVNPASGELIIYGLAESVRVTLRDVSGRQVFSTTLAAGKRHLALPPLARGVYILALRNEEGKVYSVRLLRE